MSITQITERELALQCEFEDAQYAGRLIVQRCDRLVAERDALKERCEHSEAWESDAKRLALELECLLMSCDLPAASKWWGSAHEAMELHRQLIADIYTDAKGKS